MSDAIVVLCPGQGAQAVGMGRAWADASDAARAIFEQADAVLGDELGAPLSALCFDGPPETLNRTDVSQPAIYVASVASWHGWGDHPPLAATAGLSLGEYTALHLAGAFSFEDGLRLVTLRGRAMQDAAEAAPGGMLALIGADEAAAQRVCDEARQGAVLVCANFNAPGQVVLSGDAEAISRAQERASADGLRTAPLPVAGAFHSPLMEPAADRLAEALATTPVRAPGCPVSSNVTARPHEADPDSIRRRLAEQLTNPVRWADGCANLRAEPSLADAAWHELAPGKSLAGMMRRIDRAVRIATHDQPEG
ncbi:MAG: ACP S-malonyltransferase [Planctomycetota bacterium]